MSYLRVWYLYLLNNNNIDIDVTNKNTNWRKSIVKYTGFETAYTNNSLSDSVILKIGD